MTYDDNDIGSYDDISINGIEQGPWKGNPTNWMLPMSSSLQPWLQFAASEKNNEVQNLILYQGTRVVLIQMSAIIFEASLGHFLERGKQ